jgi:hypothetical protein
MESNIAINSCVQLILVNFWSQFLTSHAIFNHRAYVKWVDQIIFCKFSSFFIRDVTSWSTIPMPQALRPNTYNNCFEVNLTKVGFSNGERCFTTIISLSDLCWALAQVWLTTFWSFCLYTTMAFLKMWVFILTWFWYRRFFLEVEGLQGLAFSTTKPCTSFKCLVNIIW